MANLPIDLPPELAEQLTKVLDIEGKIPRALEALGPIGDRDVVLLDAVAGLRAGQLTELGARVTPAPLTDPAHIEAPDDSADVVVGMWTSLGTDLNAQVAEAERVLRPGGRLLVLHDYGRDDVSRLRGDRPEYGTWSHRNGPFLGSGFKVRVVHCFWTFESLELAAAFLTDAFGPTGAEVAAAMKRPRLTYNVAVYHTTLGVTR